ncbi:hypothetical protein EDD17DRAFT_696225 [Pisolithus thermaeus]|nr:hypothetical protein EV401DRAFT_2023222 [Pisolithus croceorrhizus]KAI6161306.1 hypothetical protein EDD17DRAFT_696225 [Pisolithus thermaeus]
MSKTPSPSQTLHPPPAHKAQPAGLAAPHAVGPLDSTLRVSEHLGDVIPPAHDYRTLVLCFDGTGSEFNTMNSNVGQFFTMLKKDSPNHQMVYYHAGMGTSTVPRLSNMVDMMIGTHFDAHVMDGYEFLMQSYQAGDRICLFGFSSGAYTARALAGMLHKVGLLPRSNHQQVPFAYKMYSQDDGEGWEQSREFKKAFSIDVNVEFVGVWDTVNSVGIVPRRLPFTRANNKIRYFRHALALDEHRVRFIPSFCHQLSDTDNDEQEVRKSEAPHTCEKKSYALHISHRGKSGPNADHHGCEELEQRFSQSKAPTDVQEVWFAGCHRDVGGGAVRNGTRHSLSRISLRWMIRECFKARTGILFHGCEFQKIGMDHKTLYPYPHVWQRPPPLTSTSTVSLLPHKLGGDLSSSDIEDTGFVSEEHEDLADALADIHDRLKERPAWWVLEGLPQQIRYQRDEDNAWVTKISINRGEGRHVPRQASGVYVHRTVKIRMEAEALQEKYQPKAKLTVKPTWVD